MSPKLKCHQNWNVTKTVMSQKISPDFPSTFLGHSEFGPDCLGLFDSFLLNFVHCMCKGNRFQTYITQKRRILAPCKIYHVLKFQLGTHWHWCALHIWCQVLFQISLQQMGSNQFMFFFVTKSMFVHFWILIKKSLQYLVTKCQKKSEWMSNFFA